MGFQTSHSYCFIPGGGGKAPGNQWIGGWVNPRACLDAVEKRIYLAASENPIHCAARRCSD
jgi:hypothetical protein